MHARSIYEKFAVLRLAWCRPYARSGELAGGWGAMAGLPRLFEFFEKDAAAGAHRGGAGAAGDAEHVERGGVVAG